jgi:hypothetical protein
MVKEAASVPAGISRFSARSRTGGNDTVIRLMGWGVRLLGVGESDWVGGGRAVVVVQKAPLPRGDHQSLCVARRCVLPTCPGTWRAEPAKLNEAPSGVNY